MLGSPQPRQDVDSSPGRHAQWPVPVFGEEAVEDGSLKGKVKLGKRKVGIRAADVEDWISKMPMKVVT